MVSYTPCPGVPELEHKCTKKLLTRKLCEDCERLKKTIGTPGRRCPGVPAVGHSCNLLVCRRIRCESCQRIYRQHQRHLAELDKQIERFCLKCNKKFIATNRFNRLCKNCRSGNCRAENTGFDDTMYSINVGRRR